MCRPNSGTRAVAYLGGPRCDGLHLWPDHENFLQATLYEKVRFLPFSSKNCKIQQCLMVFCVSKFQKNGRICGLRWTFRSKKYFSFRGALPPWPPDQGLCPWTPLGAPPSDPCYRLALRALTMPPPLPNPKYATELKLTYHHGLEYIMRLRWCIGLILALDCDETLFHRHHRDRRCVLRETCAAINRCETRFRRHAWLESDYCQSLWWKN